MQLCNFGIMEERPQSTWTLKFTDSHEDMGSLACIRNLYKTRIGSTTSSLSLTLRHRVPQQAFFCSLATASGKVWRQSSLLRWYRARRQRQHG
mmetsp:Transcript_3704/g.8636  ORF Transcript_3704/g.8636 Transcript_3704/m.8636 type:complete len:93 (-) Transcript_3704:1813-2091(-)